MVGCLTMSIDITGIDKVELLKLLWNNSKPAVFYAFSIRFVKKYSKSKFI